jgi:hypothetical protein
LTPFVTIKKIQTDPLPLFSGNSMQPGRPWAALAVDSGEPEWSAYGGALGRKFLRLDQFLKSTSAKAEENVPNPKLFE